MQAVNARGLPALRPAWPQIRAQLGDVPLALMLDFDGTLVPRSADPASARLDSDARALLAKLAEHLPVAIVTGRDLSDIVPRVGLPQLYYAGCHGLAIEGPTFRQPGPEPAAAAIAAVAQRLVEALPVAAGVIVEPKRFSVSVHRGAAVPGDWRRLKDAVRAIVATVAGVVTRRGESLIEVRPDLPLNKGTAVTSLLDHLQQQQGRRCAVVVVGDDWTDEDALRVAAARADGVAVLVGRPDRSTHAHWVLQDVHDVWTWLRQNTGPGLRPASVAVSSGTMGERDPHLNHWADQAADRTLRAHPDRSEVAVAAGITPSGVVHIGNFREVITVDLVARALRDRGINVRFIYSWDDFDVFRKVPKDAPLPEILTEQLGRSIAVVPDPWGQHDSYASHHIAAFEAGLAPLGIEPEFIRQSQRYRAGTYAEGIQKALQGADVIRELLNAARREHGARSLLGNDWLPLSGFCDACGKDPLTFTWDGAWSVHAVCGACNHEANIDLRQGGNLKLPWRVDWPMRWAFEHICFEPGGKDHSSAGGSYDTAKGIVRDIYGWEAPQYVGYDFVSVKGQGGKISSSKGGVVTVQDCLEIYEPEVLRWMFVSYRPNTEFAISFDLDAIKIYEDYDRMLRLAYDADDGGRKDSKRQTARRTMQLSDVGHRKIEAGTPAPWLPGFRHLSVIVQIFDGDVDATRAFYEREGQRMNDEERRRFDARTQCVWRWIEQYAPDDFRYAIRAEPEARTLPDQANAAMKRLVAVLQAAPNADDATLGASLKNLLDGLPIERGEFYPIVYDLLVARDRGPKLSTLLAAMGNARSIPLLAASLG